MIPTRCAARPRSAGHTGASSEAGTLIEQVLSDQPETDIALEGWFYRFAHLESKRKEALRHVKQLIAKGVRSPGWPLQPTVEYALSQGHPEPELLCGLAAVIGNNALLFRLDNSRGWLDA
jgi:hypothetical protein